MEISLCDPFLLGHEERGEVWNELQASTSGVEHIMREIAQMVTAALSISIQEVKQVQGDADMWQRTSSENLTDEIKFSENSFLDLKEITDLDFLLKILRDGLTEKISQLRQGFTNVDKILD
ncbi:hypothetical protein DNTS_018323 [Danionella cerebrum]|uniref:Uncharacterized protein n=1 Tax=Danionella cerebrum TaxID=2873325 RepID=A0A553QER1_9TELE|nr:hypothetical protein DNTS_018323 [Danionella translucida]